MGNADSSAGAPGSDDIKNPDAVLYYFAGRGRADQIRWLMAASRVTFNQVVIKTRAEFLDLRSKSLLFGQMPMLQIDGLELVQSQSTVRYLARRADLAGQTREEEVQADMMAETINDLILNIIAIPFVRNDPERLEAMKSNAREKFSVMGARFEQLLQQNGGVFLVGNSLTYADILLAHAITWFVEELGPDILDNTPLLVGLQNGIISLPEIQSFIRSKKYYPIGDAAYVKQVSTVLDRRI